MALLDTIRRALVPAHPSNPRSHHRPPPAQKAALGRGAWVMEHGTPLHYGRVDTPRFMKEAQRISHTRQVGGDRRARGLGQAGDRAVAPRGPRRRGDRGHRHRPRVRLPPAHGAPEPAHDAARPVADHQPPPRRVRQRLLVSRPAQRPQRRTARHLLHQPGAHDAEPGHERQPHRLDARRRRPYQLDYGSTTGIPLDLEEVLHFVFEPPDWGHLGHGLVEAAMSTIADPEVRRPLRRGHVRRRWQARRHRTAEGGHPPATRCTRAFSNNFRNIAESPDATKRTIVTQGAVDYTFTSATPSDLDLDEMLTLSARRHARHLGRAAVADRRHGGAWPELGRDGQVRGSGPLAERHPHPRRGDVGDDPVPAHRPPRPGLAARHRGADVRRPRAAVQAGRHRQDAAAHQRGAARDHGPAAAR